MHHLHTYFFSEGSGRKYSEVSRDIWNVKVHLQHPLPRPKFPWEGPSLSTFSSPSPPNSTCLDRKHQLCCLYLYVSVKKMTTSHPTSPQPLTHRVSLAKSVDVSSVFGSHSCLLFQGCYAVTLFFIHDQLWAYISLWTMRVNTAHRCLWF